jgi:protein gp37
MAETSNIEWTNATWNPVTGCDRVSAGCANCYAERFAERWRGIPGHPYEQGFDLKVWPERLGLPLTWKEPKFIFVNSMSDLFHEGISIKFIKEVFKTIKAAHWHTFQLLTKRSGRLKELAIELEWPKNLWMGVSVENQRVLQRVKDLQKVPAKVRFLSVEPLLEEIPNLPLKGIHWVIVGGESGPGARPIHSEWVTGIRDQCLVAKVPFFFKQWGGVFKKRQGRLLEGRQWDEMPLVKR